MTHPATEQPLKVVAVRLPQSLIDAAQRYADLYHSSVSTLLREGLELRLHHREEASEGQTALPPATVTMLTQLAMTLTTAAAEVRNACQDGTETVTYNGHTIKQEEAYNGHTSMREEMYDSNTDLVTPETVETSYDQTSAPAPAEQRRRPPKSEQASPIPLTAQPQGDAEVAAPIPPFDPEKHRLGKLCAQGHAWGASGQSLRANNKAGYCLACNAALKKAKRQAQPA